MRIERQRGATLLLFLGVLLVIALGVLAQQLLRAVTTSGARNSGAVLDALELALVAHVAQHRRLPCPASGVLADGAALAGVEAVDPNSGACTSTSQIDGVVPWITLGLSATAALDPWQGRISYRVAPPLASRTARLMNMSWCDPAGARTASSGPILACTAGCSGSACMHPNNYLYGKGLAVRHVGGGWLQQPSPPWSGTPATLPTASGAAFVLISHGPSGAGAYNGAGRLQSGTVAPGSAEVANANGQAWTAASVFLQADADSTAGATHFDDTLRHPGIASVLARAQLGPRTPH